jgi:hypothetical protein
MTHRILNYNGTDDLSPLVEAVRTEHSRHGTLTGDPLVIDAVTGMVLVDWCGASGSNHWSWMYAVLPGLPVCSIAVAAMRDTQEQARRAVLGDALYDAVFNAPEED